MHKVVLISFADSRFRNALKRLEAYTKDFPFTERHFHTEKNSFTKSYWRKLKPWLYRRGYGYWEWKSKLVKQYLEQLSDGDFLLWSDVGVYWNSSEAALKRFNEYLAMLNKDINILAFQEPYIEQEWTKGDVLMELGVYDNEEICRTNQLWGGAFIIRKSPVSTQLVNDWVEINEINKEFLTDKKSIIPNKTGFKEHRHDQSSFSILVKKIPHIELSHTETQALDGKWESLTDYPIQARRLKEVDRPKSEIIKNKLLRPWRNLLNFYFERIRHYEYTCKHYPW